MHAGILDQYPTPSESYEFDRVRRAIRQSFVKSAFMAQHIAAERVCAQWPDDSGDGAPHRRLRRAGKAQVGPI
jgi:hypothetical protein